MIAGSIPTRLFMLKMCAHNNAGHLKLTFQGEKIAMSTCAWGFSDIFKL